MTPRKQCDQCEHWHSGYRLQGMKVPAFCNRHFHSQAGDDPVCEQFTQKEELSDG